MADIPNKKDIKDLNEELGFLEDQLLSIAERLSSSIKDALEDVKNEGREVGEILANQVNKSIKDLAKGLNSTLANTEKLAKGQAGVADIQKQIADRELKRLAISRNLTTLLNQELITKEEYDRALAEINEAEESHNALLKDQLDLAKKIQKNLGITGKLIKGISKIPILGDLINADEAMAKVSKKAAEEGSSRLSVMGEGFKALGSSLLENLSDPLVRVGLLVKGLGLVAKGFMALVKLAGRFAGKAADIGQSFLGMSNNIIGVRDNLNQMAASNFFMNFEEAMQHMQSINDLTGTAIQLNQKQVGELQKMTNLFGISQENAAKLFEFSTLMNQPLEDSVAQLHQVTAELNASQGQILNVNDVMDKFVSASHQAKNNLGNNPKVLAQAAFQASKLGLSLSQIQAASETTLDFQSSIEKEMNAELLLGKNLNLETLRRAALTGDVKTQGEEIERIIKENIKSTENNVIKQQALAETLGISVEEMFAINDEMKLQDKLAKMGISKAVTLADYNALALKKQKEMEKQLGRNVTLDEAKLRISKQELQQLEQQAKSAQTASRLFETIKETFINGLVQSGVLEKINNLLLKLSDPAVLNPLLDKLESAAGSLGKLVMWALDNPGKVAGGVAAAFAAALLGSKLIPQAVFVTGGKAFGKLGKTITKAMGKSGTKVATKAVMKETGKVVTGAAAQSAVKAGTATATKTVTKNVGKTAAKTVGKTAAKTAGKSLVKKIPGVGLLAGLYFAGEKLLEGDFAGAGLEIASGAASTIPGVGTAASLAIDAGIAARDISKASSGEAADFISRPGQPIQKFRKDDIIVGGTNLGGSDNGEVVTLLKELISAVKQGGDVYIDGAKAGRSLALATSRMG